MSRPITITIAGGSASGKGVLASQLASHLGRVTIVPLDAFYRDLSHLSSAERAATDFDDPQALDWDEAARVFTALKSGAPAHRPDYDFTTHTRRPDRVPVEPAPFIIWEGLWALHTPWLRSETDHSIFLDCPQDLRLDRRLDRDTSERGRSAEAVRSQFFSTVAVRHDRHVQPQASLARHRLVSPWSLQDFDSLTSRLAAHSTPLP